jgi:hypothetical protein
VTPRRRAAEDGLCLGCAGEGNAVSLFGGDGDDAYVFFVCQGKHEVELESQYAGRGEQKGEKGEKRQRTDR